MLYEFTYEAKTIDEAVEKGLKDLGRDRDDVSVEVLRTPEKGFLGIGATLACVKLSYEGPDLVREETPAEEPAPKELKAEAKAEKLSAKLEKAEKKLAKKAAKREAKAEEGAEKIPAVFKKQPSASSEPASSAEEFIYGLVAKMGLDNIDIDIKKEENNLYITATGAMAGQLIGRRGDTLNAIQYLLSLVENKGKDEYVKVVFNVESYREKRQETLEKLARRLAVTAVKTKRNIYLEPMQNYERKIIHSTLQDFNGVTTYSTGVEPNRKVVIAYDANGSKKKEHSK